MEPSISVMQQNLAVKPGEKVLIITDSLLEPGIAEMFLAAAKRFTKKVELLFIKPTGQHGAEPDSKTAQKMWQSDVVLLCTYYSHLIQKRGKMPLGGVYVLPACRALLETQLNKRLGLIIKKWPNLASILPGS